jgi:hypothetical protein
MDDDEPLPEQLDAGERAEAFGWESYVRAMPEGFASAVPGTWRIGDAVGFGVDVEPHALFNRVIGLGALAPATAETLDGTLAPWQATGRQTIVHVIPGSTGADLALAAAGFRVAYRRRNWIGIPGANA